MSNEQEQATDQQEQQQTEEQQQEQQQVDEQSPPINQEQKEEPPKQEKIEEDLEKKGFDYSALEKEYFDNNGELSKETLEKLNELGFSNEFINDFINGKKALYEQELNDLAQSVGGRENYDNLIGWASKNLEPNVIASINGIKDKTILKEYILPALKTQMETKEGVLPEITLQGAGQGKGVELFESQEQMFAAVRDPRYLKDEAYQAKVTARIRASREAGIDLGL